MRFTPFTVAGLLSNWGAYLLSRVVRVCACKISSPTVKGLIVQVLLRPTMPGGLEKITFANTAYLTKAQKPLVSLGPPAVRVRRRGKRGGKLSNCLGQQTTVLVCATAVPTKGSERLLATRPQSRARGRRTKAAATSGCDSSTSCPFHVQRSGAAPTLTRCPPAAARR